MPAARASASSSDDDDDEESGPTVQELFEKLDMPMWSRRHTFATTCCSVMLAVCATWLALGLIYPDRIPHKYSAPSLTTPFPAAGAQGNFDSSFMNLGCFQLSPGDAGADATAPFRDPSCVNRPPDGSACRSGLPFYRLHIAGEAQQADVISWRMCASFCSLKGFDISGVVQAIECRCGATKENTQAWAGQEPPPSLVWQPDAATKLEDGSPGCSIVVHQFVKAFQGGSTGPKGFDKTSQDASYVTSLIIGRIVPIVEDSMVNASTGAVIYTMNDTAGSMQQKWVPIEGLDDMLRLDSSGQDSSLPKCYPNRCATGWPWPLWSSLGDTGIPIAVSDSVSSETAKAFQEAVDDVTRVSCLRFTQVSVFYNATYKIRVRGDLDGCYTNIVGFPAGHSQDVEINLGWCNSRQQKGNMIHELLHAMGMGHEQTRPDRLGYVEINWASLPTADDRAQYEASKLAYTGGDRGPAPYDYDSIMHYPADPAMHTLPLVNGKGTHDSEVGQRLQMSPQDVLQLRQMYQCDAKTLPCVDLDEGVGSFVKFKSGAGATCAQAKSLCQHPTMGKDVSYFCGKTCNQCPMNPYSSYDDDFNDVAEGCADANEDLCQSYKTYCPGHITGYEQFMSTHCKKTCWISSACGGGTTPAPPTGAGSVTTTADQGESLQLHFELQLSGYNLDSPADQQAFEKQLGSRLGPLFKTDANVSAIEARCMGDQANCDKGVVTVQLQCGCKQYGAPCSIGCAELQDQLMKATPKQVRKDLARNGFAGIQVQKVMYTDVTGTVREVFGTRMFKYGAWGGLLASLVVVVMLCHRLSWIRQKHRSQHRVVQKDEYQAMSEEST